MSGPQGSRRSTVVYTKEGMGGIENLPVKDFARQHMNQGDHGGSQGSGSRQKGIISSTRNRNTKRGLQGKYEVCTPVGQKREKSTSCVIGAEEEGSPEVVSPLKINVSVEAAGQPRREP
ncbi:hypothetical protein V6N13_056250 [Hibiscus sabdariffa]|uniref:Uncharacterized protein n=1 Tax=Hibiscus sabdariffa TaxID=183260 RepID=A0ABR2BCS9_9ROSI